jgi:alpha-beta hydrolase superfamily lysophospholipase
MIALLGISFAAHAAGVSLQAADGVPIHATVIHPESSTRGAIFVHMEGRTGKDWAFLTERLAKNGLTSIAVDLRGHGQSSGERAHDAMAQDVQAAAAWLADNGVEDIACVGAEIGANLCLIAANEDPRIRSVAALSPRLNPSGLNAPKAMQSWGGSILAVASAEDAPGSKCVDLLAQIAGDDRAEVVVLSEEGVGTQMLSRSPSLEGTLVDWLSRTELDSADIVGVQPDTTDNTTVEAEGEKLRTHQ